MKILVKNQIQPTPEREKRRESLPITQLQAPTKTLQAQQLIEQDKFKAFDPGTLSGIV